MGYKATSRHGCLLELSRNATIQGWRTFGYSSNGSIVGEVSPTDFSQYRSSGFFELKRLDSEPQVALGFRVACEGDSGWIGQMVRLGNSSNVFCELRDNSPIVTVRTEALNRLERELQRSEIIPSLQLLPTTLSQSRLFGSTYQKPKAREIPWFVDLDGAFQRLPTKGNLGATPLVVDGKGIVWGKQTYAGNTMSPYVPNLYQLCRWIPNSSNNYAYEPIENLIDSRDTICSGVSLYGKDCLLLTHQRIRDRQIISGISILNTETLEEIRRYEFPQGEQLESLFCCRVGDGLVYSSVVAFNGLNKAHLNKMCWLSLTEHRNVPLVEKLGSVQGLSEQSIGNLMIIDIDPDGRMLAVVGDSSLSSEKKEQIFVLEPI